MEPLISTGDVIAAERITAHDIAIDGSLVTEGMVLLAEDPGKPGTLYTHRVIEIRPDKSMITKGDANSTPDSTVLLPEHVVGIERLLVPGIGWPLQQLWKGNPGPAALFIALTMAAQLILARERKAIKAATTIPAGDSECTNERRKHGRRRYSPSQNGTTA